MSRFVAIWLIVVGLAVLTNCKRMESRENSYVDYEAAMNAGEMSRGWIPAYIPKSAKEIRLKYNIDTNQVWLFFRFNSSDIGLLLHSCEESIQNEINYPRESPNWWSKDLRVVSIDKNKLESSSFLFLKCTDKGSMAIDDKRNQAYYWHLGNN